MDPYLVIFRGKSVYERHGQKCNSPKKKIFSLVTFWPHRHPLTRQVKLRSLAEKIRGYLFETGNYARVHDLLFILHLSEDLQIIMRDHCCIRNLWIPVISSHMTCNCSYSGFLCLWGTRSWILSKERIKFGNREIVGTELETRIVRKSLKGDILTQGKENNKSFGQVRVGITVTRLLSLGQEV